MANIAKVKFKLVNTTKGALRYQEVDDQGNSRQSDQDGAAINTLYLRKAFLKGKEPQAITVSLDT